MNANRFVATAILFVISAPLLGQTPPLRLTISLPARIVDGDPLMAQAEIRNASTRVLSTANDNRAIAFVFRPTRDGRTTKLFVKQEHSRLVAQRGGLALAPAERYVFQSNVFEDYPFGVPAGSYEVTARYTIYPPTSDVSWHGTLVSDPVPLEILPQSNDAYKQFLAVSDGLMKEIDEASVDSALTFAASNPKFAYTRQLLSFLLYRVPEKYALKIADLSIANYAGTTDAEAAAREKKRIEHQRRDKAARESYYAALKQQAEVPANVAVREAAAALGPIRTQADFARYENFLRTYPNSYFSPEARWLTIQAVSEGILPQSGNDRDAVLADLYSDLVARYSTSYWGERAARDATVRALLQKHSER